MKQSGGAFELKNLFRNVYFWLAVGGAIFLFYVAFIAFTFLPRSSSEVVVKEPDKEKVSVVGKTEVTEKSRKSVSTKSDSDLQKAQVKLITNGGWVDSDDRKMTIVIQVFNLNSSGVDEIIRSGGIELEIDGEPAEIINSEPYRKNGFLTRTKAVLSVEKFEKFNLGETQSVEINTTLRYGGETITKVINNRFNKGSKTEVEGIKIHWK